jgi:hypothetical protein
MSNAQENFGSINSRRICPHIRGLRVDSKGTGSKRRFLEERDGKAKGRAITMTYKEWIESLPRCIGEDGVFCDGYGNSEYRGYHEEHCPMYGGDYPTLEDAFNAGLREGASSALDDKRT